MAGENEKEEKSPYEKELNALWKSHAELLRAAFVHYKSPLPVSAMLHVLHSSMMDLEVRVLEKMNKAAMETVDNENAEKRDS
ncbi:MAG: hypothetical protein IJG84_11505 [Kiritimatiellae bacterium]|nr:hypothetical protein [Kiritimatiellia bacterium]